jgi:hypothetical protein
MAEIAVKTLSVTPKSVQNAVFMRPGLSSSFKTIHFVTAIAGSFPHNALTDRRSV